MKTADCHSQARRELWDGRRSVYPSQCSLHALPGLQRKTRHTAGKCGQLWKGRIQNSKILLSSEETHRSVFLMQVSVICMIYDVCVVFLKLLRRFGCCKPKIIPPSESSSVFNLTVSWPGVVLVGAAALISPAAQCEAAKALCLCGEHLISSQRRCAFVCSHNPEKFLSLATLSHSLYFGPRPQPPTQPTPPPLGSSCRKILKKRRGLD